MADPDPNDTKEAKKRFLLTAGFADQEALLAPPPEPVPTPPRQLPSGPRLTPVRAPRGPLRVALGVHRFVSDPTAHPSWPTFVTRVLDQNLPAWQAQVLFRLALTALHGRDPETRLSAVARLCLELDQWLVPKETLVVGPAHLGAPSASPVASPALPGLSLFAGLDFPEATPEAIASLPAALAATAAWHAPALRLFAPEGEPAPLDLVRAIGEAKSTPIDVVPLSYPAPVDPRLPAVLRRAPIPAARIAIMRALASAARSVHGLPPPGADTPGLLAQITARFASPLATVVATALAELEALTRITDPAALGLDLPLRYPGALAEARQALAASRTVPRWVIANTQGGDRGLIVATLMGRLPSADPRLLEALAGLAPADFEAALHETVKASWIDPAAKAAAKEWLVRLGRAV